MTEICFVDVPNALFFAWIKSFLHVYKYWRCWVKPGIYCNNALDFPQIRSFSPKFPKNPIFCDKVFYWKIKITSNDFSCETWKIGLVINMTSKIRYRLLKSRIENWARNCIRTIYFEPHSEGKTYSNSFKIQTYKY